MKLTNEIRNKILANIVAEHAVAGKARELIDRSHALAMRLLRSEYPEGVTTNAEFLSWYKAEKAKHTTTMFGMSFYVNRVTFYRDRDRKIIAIRKDSFNVSMGGQHREMYLSGDYHDQEGKQFDGYSPWMGVIVPGYALSKLESMIEFDESGSITPISIPYSTITVADRDIITEQDSIDAARRTVWDEYLTLKSTVQATLARFNSDSKLIEAWPEVKPFIPAEKKKTGTAIALDAKTLNAICGLPK